MGRRHGLPATAPHAGTPAKGEPASSTLYVRSSPAAFECSRPVAALRERRVRPADSRVDQSRVAIKGDISGQHETVGPRLVLVHLFVEAVQAEDVVEYLALALQLELL